jgi:drug/metabolite transporter (DMT)-like permease
LLAVLEPLLNPVWVFLFAGENPGIWSLVGGVIVVFIITLWYVYDARHPQAASSPQIEVKPA